MDLGNIKTGQLKNLNVCDEIKKDALFQDLAQVCRNDEKYQKNSEFSNGTYYKGYSIYNYDFLPHVAGHLVPFVIFIVFYFVYVKIGILPEWIFRIVFFAAHLCSAVMAFIDAGFHSIFEFSCVFNFVTTIASYILIRFLNFPILTTLLVCVSLQFALRIVALLDLKHKDDKMTNEGLKEDREKAEKFIEYAKFYDKVIKDAEMRIKICSVELLRRGVQPDFHKRRFWWQNNDLKNRLFRSGKLLDDPHISRYKCEQTLDEYDYRGNYVGKTNHKYTEIIDKRFFLTVIPKGDHRHILRHIEDGKFQCLGYPSVDLSFLDCYEIRAIGCKWTILENTKSETIVRNTPTASEIEKARSQIENSRNADERLYNAFTKGVDLTMDELLYVTGGRGVSLEEQMYASNLKSNDLDKYIKSNTHDEVKHSNLSNQKEGITVFLYVIGEDIYFSTEPPYAKAGKDYYYDGGKYGIDTRDQEIEAAIHYLLSSDVKLANNLLSKIMGGQENEYQEQLASKIFHSVAGSSTYFDKYFSLDKKG